MYYLRLFATYLRLGVLGELEYRANFWISLLQSTLDLGVALGGLAVVFSHTDTLGGWRPEELLALIGVYFFIGGLIRTLIRPSMIKFMEDVRQGTLDFTLTKPADSQVLVSIQRVEIWRLVDVLIALPVVGHGAGTARRPVGSCRNRSLCRHTVVRRLDHLQFLAYAQHLRILVRARRKHPGYLYEHVAGWPLAR